TGRRLELLYRRQRDEQLLRRYLRRPEQDAAFEDLLAGRPAAPDRPAPWALHLVGAGGCGKTMLVRHICTALADAAGALTARIDFDYLNPDYPSRAPGLLLWSFAQELRAHDLAGEAARDFDKGDELLR